MRQNNPDKPLAVVKVGGDVLLDDAQKNGLTKNVADLVNHGWQVVLLHGGGPQVNRLQTQLGLTPKKVGGRRITGPDDLRVVKQAIVGEVNVDLVSALIREGIPAFGCHGASGRLIQAVKRPPRVVSGAGDTPVDFGEVGDVVGIDQAALTPLLAAGFVPVIATLGVGDDGRIFNINADTTVVRLAEALSADLLILTTAVGAVFEDLSRPDSRIPMIDEVLARQLIQDGVIADGMIPKIEEALAVVRQGVGAVVILSGAAEGAFLKAAQGSTEFGTRIVDSR
ncbi:MAG: acetylglutamate kinase [Gammaproteobacteria bacterium]|nr:MAG: acetylglutamate kinase [Gammaproteobacteria bacterium]